MQVVLALHRPVVRTYAVHSSALEQALRSLERRGWWGHYEPRGRMSYDTNARGRVETILLVAEPQIVLPDWRGKQRVPVQARRAWNRMVAALLRHEREHHRFFVRAVRECKRKLETRGEVTERAANRAWGAMCER